MSERIGLFLPLIVTSAFVFALLACGPKSGDVAAWEKEDGGPEKLAEVVTNENAKDTLRRDAALALMRLERRGRHVGLDLLIAALARVQDPARARLIDLATPMLVMSLGAPRPEVGPDPTLSSKDAIVALLAHDLVTDAADKTKLNDALFAWLGASTLARLGDSAQRYGARKTLTVVGARGLRLLPPLITASTSSEDLRRICDLTKDLGDDAAKVDVTNALVNAFREIESPDGLARLRAEVASVNAKQNVKASDAQIEKQVTLYQRNKLGLILDGLARSDGAAPFLLDVAADEKESADTRALALGALKGHEGELTEPLRARIFALIKRAGTPEVVLDAAFWRVRDLTRDHASDAVVRASAELAQSTDWRVRLVGKLLALAQLTKDHVADFMRGLPEKGPIGLAEIYAYASELKERFGNEVLRPFLTSPNFGARLVALASFADDKKTLAPFDADPAPLARCDSCGWRCDATLTDAEPRTVGDFVRACLEPSSGIPSTRNLAAPDSITNEMLKTLGTAPAPKPR